MIDILDRKRALLDNSAIQLLALSDPTAQRTNEAMDATGTRPLVSVFTATEILKGFLKSPMNEKQRARCAYLLRLEGLSFLPEKDESILIEFDRQHGVTKFLTETRSTIETRRVLRECVEHGLSPELVAAGKAHYASLPAEYETGLQYVRSNPSADEIRKMSFAQFVQTKAGDVAAQLLRGYLAGFDEPVSQEQFLATVRNASTNNGLAPTLAGLARVQLWFSWQVARSKTEDVGKRFREDLKVLAYALNAHMVVTNDDAYFAHGPEIFPEVRFMRPAELLPGV